MYPDPFIPTNPEARLTRRQMAAALTASGYPTAEATLATYATRGGGPAFDVYGRRVMYTWGLGLAWAKGRTSKIVTTTSELEVA